MNKKTVFLLIIVFVLIFVVKGLVDFDKGESVSNSLADKAEQIFTELSDQRSVEDFKKIYNILNDLSANRSEFNEQLAEAISIADNYNFDLERAEIYLKPLSSNLSVEKYLSGGVYVDLGDALSNMVYPVLFEKYGYDVNHIRNVSKNNISHIMDANGYYCDETKDMGDYIKDVWCDFYGIADDYEISYYKNDLVYSVDIPIVSLFKSEEEWKPFLNNSGEELKNVVKNETKSLLESFNGFNDMQKKILSEIYTDEETIFIENYIKSLSAEYVWNNDFMNSDAGDTLFLFYKDTVMFLDFTFSKISLEIKGYNYVNEYTSRCKILECYYLDYDENDYIDYINCDISSNVEGVLEYAINLD